MNKEDIDHLMKFASVLMSTAIEIINMQFEDKINLDIDQPESKDINNVTRELDQFIHQLYHAHFGISYPDDIVLMGEEEVKLKKNIKTITKDKLIASIDAVDGTDLVVKGMYNWCSAMFFFKPDESIVGSLVGVPSNKIGMTAVGTSKGVPSGIVYHATDTGAYKSGKKIAIPQLNRKRTLEQASICFYGQKAGNLLSIFESKAFIDKMKAFMAKSQAPVNARSKGKYSVPFRIYNLGGNPMMVRLTEGTIDAVIELRGQKLYDVVPGAYIAQKAGAYWGDMKGNVIDSDYFKRNGLLLKTESKLTYILAASESLYREILELFRK
jgi:fructose-1,6-bisphosphatase/inositol monophosphatase family enzyme